MAIRPKGNKFQVDVTVNGVRAPRVSCDTLAAARVVEARFKAHLIAEGDPAELVQGETQSTTSTITLAQLVDATVSTKWRGTKGEEIATHNAHSWCEALGYDFPAHKLGPTEVSDVIDEWTTKGLAAGTINRKIAALSVMLNIAEQRGWIDKKFKLDRKKEYEGRLRYYSDAEVESLIDHAQSDPQMMHLIMLAVETGMRQGELLAMTKRDVNLRKRIIELGETKGNKRRSVPLTNTAWVVCKQLTSGISDHERIFEDRLTPRNISRLLATWKTKMGLTQDDEACFHTLRHTTCSRLVQAGVPVVVVQKWMGHARIETTMKYAHLAPDSLDVALDALNNWKDTV